MWKLKPLSIGMDSKLLAAYMKAARDPFPRKSVLLREVLNAILKRKTFSDPERRQILQLVQFISAYERSSKFAMPDLVRKAEIARTIEELEKFKARREKRRSHDCWTLINQKALLQIFIDQWFPYPKNKEERESWIKKYFKSMWYLTTALPCFCCDEYTRPKEMHVDSQEGVIEEFLAAIHQFDSVSAFQQYLKRSLRTEIEWRGPIKITKEIEKVLFGPSGLKSIRENRDGSIDYELPPGKQIVKPFRANSLFERRGPSHASRQAQPVKTPLPSKSTIPPLRHHS